MLLQVAVNILLNLFLFILFGYCEVKYDKSGIIISVLLLLILLRKGYYIIPTILVGVQSFFLFQSSLTESYITYFILTNYFSLILLNQLKKTENNITLKPYEKEIRQLLLRKNPSILHKVDDLLKSYRFKEEELYQELLNQYERNSDENSRNTITTKNYNNLNKNSVFDDNNKSKSTSLNYINTSNNNSNNNISSNQKILAQKDKEIIENAKKEAKDAIQRRMDSFSPKIFKSPK